MQIRDLIPWSRAGGTPAPAGGDNPLLSLQRDMNRMFDEFWSRFGRPGFGSLDLFGTPGVPRVDVAETEKEIEVTVELPGMTDKDVELSVSSDALTVKGEKKSERKEEQKGYHLSERSYGSFYRTIPLPPGAEADKAEAEFKNGILTVRLPKSPEVQANTKKIEVKAD